MPAHQHCELFYPPDRGSVWVCPELDRPWSSGPGQFLGSYVVNRMFNIRLVQWLARSSRRRKTEWAWTFGKRNKRDSWFETWWQILWPFFLMWYKIRTHICFCSTTSGRARATCKTKFPQKCQKIARCWECAVYVAVLRSPRSSPPEQQGINNMTSQPWSEATYPHTTSDGTVSCLFRGKSVTIDSKLVHELIHVLIY